MPVCKASLDSSISKVSEEIRSIQDELREDKIYSHQRRRFGKKAKLGSRQQLAYVLFDVLKIPDVVPQRNEGGDYKLDDEVLEEIDLPYIRRFQRLQKLDKLLGTYLKPFSEERTERGRVHGFINLHTVRSYRSSFDSPNLQNIPVRDPEIGGIIRSIVRPESDEWVIVEADYGALEVHIAACYHKDPRMIEYLETGHDFHADYTKQCFFLEESEKHVRAAVKGLFTFAEFYGSAYDKIATGLWLFGAKTKRKDGTPLLEQLGRNGITHLGDKRSTDSSSYMNHIRKMDQQFWASDYPVYDRWRKEWYESYVRHGYFHTLTGFRWWGSQKRNFVINAPVQGSAFHCLLLSLIEITKRLEQRNMRSRLFCEIHDSLVAVVHKSELEEYIALAKDVMQNYVRQVWPWVVLGLKVEIEIGESWAAKMPEETWRQKHG